MTRTIIRYGLLLALVWLVVAPAPAEAQSIAGKWLLEIFTPEGGEYLDLTIALAGTKITGDIVSEFGTFKIDGWIDEEGDATFSFTFEQGGEKFAMTFHGWPDQEADHMNGDVGIDGISNIRYWRARRP